MILEEIIKKSERMIQKEACRYYVDGHSFEDLVQLGRIAVWEVSKNYDLKSMNSQHIHRLLRKCVQRKFISNLRASSAKKRIRLDLTVSLDAPFELNESDNNLYDIIPSPIIDHLVNKKDLLNIRHKAVLTKNHDLIRGVVWVLVEYLNIKKEEIPQKIRYQTFIDNNLSSYLWIFFNNSPFRAINYAYPGVYLREEFVRAPNRYWKGKIGQKRGVKELKRIMAKTNYPSELYPKILTAKFLSEFKLARPWQIHFNYDRFAYLDAAFPGKYYPWEFSVTPRKYFDIYENRVKAVKWLVEEKLGFDMGKMSIYDVWKEKVALKITKQIFNNHELREIMAIYKSPEPILKKVYPDKFLPWSFPIKPKWKGEKGKKLAAEATRWVIEEYAGISPLNDSIGFNFFIQNGLRGMITAKSLGLNSSPKAALQNAYPHLNFD